MSSINPKSAAPCNIAITGLSCRFPGNGSSPKRFWESLCRGESAWSEIPKAKFDRRAFGPNVPQGAHFLEQDIGAFDAPFFSITAAEARAMDPQQRLILEVVYEALESAGYPLPALRGTRTGVFMGQLTSDYLEVAARDLDAAVAPSKFALTGLQRASLANRVSYLLDLRGPSFTLDTACSSSLTALHLACESLARGEADVAIVGGCNVIVNPDMFMALGGQGFLAPDGRCKAFDASGNGYGRGEGVSAVVLRRVDDAVAYGDPVRAVIRGTGINQDGKTKGFSLPSAEAQARLIRTVYDEAGLDFSHTGYVEAHGTGTKAGDLEETTALGQTLSTGCKEDRKLTIGSVKTNIGHLEAAAGVAGVVKSVLMLEAAMIPPNVHFHNPNPAIKFDEWKLRVPTELTPWSGIKTQDGQGNLRRISINSFGYGGANAHVIMDDAKSFLSRRGLTASNGHKVSEPSNMKPRLFSLSAQDEAGLTRVKKALGTFLREKASQGSSEEDEETYLRSLAYTLNDRRSPLQWKTYAVASSLDELLTALDPQPQHEPSSNALPPAPQILSSRAPRLGFVFTGQGAQWATMGIGLMEHYPTFCSSIEAADKFLREELQSGWSAVEELSRAKSTSKLAGAEYSQALCTVLQVALVDLLREWNITPRAVVGHSSGEIAAAYCWGVLSREDAWRVAYYRGVLSSRLREESGLEGAMMAVGASAEAVEQIISDSANDEHGEAYIACINSPRSVTVSGDVDAIEKLQQVLQEKGVFARKLQVDTAYHSPHIETMAPEYFELIADIVARMPSKGQQPGMQMYSSVSGHAIDPSELGPAYWIRNAVSPVQFASAVENLARGHQGPDSESESGSAAIDVLVEVGPHSALLGPATQSLKAIGLRNIPYHSVLTRFQNATETALNLAGTLYARGYPVRLGSVNNDETASQAAKPKPKVLTELPSYPWNHSQIHWSESRIAREFRLREAPTSVLLGPRHPSTVAGESVWRGFIRLGDEAWSNWLTDHKIAGSVVCPAAGFIAMAIEAARSLADADKKLSAVRLRDIHLIAALVVDADEDVEYTVSLRPSNSSVRDTTAAWDEFSVASCHDGKSLTKHCAGLVMLEYETVSGSEEDTKDGIEATEAYQVANQLCTTVVKTGELYETMATAGLQLGPTFRNLSAVKIGMRQSCSTVDIPNVGFTKTNTGVRPHLIHPVVLDTILQSASASLLVENSEALSTAMVPKVIDELVVSANIPYQPSSALKGFSNAVKHGFKEIMADICMFASDLDEAEAGPRPVIRVSGFCCSEVAGAADSSGGGGGGGASGKKHPLLAKMVRRPALQFLSIQEQQQILEELWSHQKQENGPSAAIQGVLSEVIHMAHHNQPDLSIMEIISDAGTAQPSQSLVVDLFPHIGDVLKTSQSSVWCMDEESKRRITNEAEAKLGSEGSDLPPVELRDLKSLNSSSEPQSSDRSVDVLLMSFTHASAKSSSEIEQLTAIARQQLGQEGRLCLIIPNNDALIKNVTTGLAEWIRLDGLDRLANVSGSWSLLIGSRPTGKQAPNGVNGVHGESAKHVTILLPSTPSKACKSVASRLEKELSESGHTPVLVSWCLGSPQGDEVLPYINSRPVVSLLELDRPALASLEDERQFAHMQALILQPSSLLWVSGIDKSLEPSQAMALGLARVVRNEEPGLVCHTVHVEGWEGDAESNDRPSLEKLAENILRLFRHSLKSRVDNDNNNEFVISNGLIHTERVVEDGPLNTTLQDLLSPNDQPKTPTRVPLAEAGPISLTVQNAGLLDSLTFEPDPSVSTPLEDDDVEITVHASSLNFRDVMTTMNNLPGTLLGHDCAGVVRRVVPGGPAAAKFRVGDRVAMVQPGAHRTIHRAKLECVEHIPEGLSFEEAATIPVVHGTAWYALVDLARAQKGQSVLIHAAAGGVGQAAIMIARHVGLDVFATVGSAEKRALIRDKYGVDDGHIFNSRDTSFAAGVRRLTKGRGVDIVLNSLSGEALRQTWYCVAPFGTFVEIGKRDILFNSRLDMKPFNNSTTFTFFDMNVIIRDRRDIMARIMAGAFALQRQKITAPVGPITVYPVSDTESAFRLMQTGKHQGKIVLSFEDQNQLIPVLKKRRLPPQLADLQLDSNAIYLLAGGLGGLGRSLSRMLVAHGARKVVFLSRSGGASPAAQQLLDELRQTYPGTQALALACDIASAAAVTSAIQTAKHTLGAARVAGVLQCAMVLQDTLFRNMSFAAWRGAARPKVQGTWNLHAALQAAAADDVDFFVTLSSFAAVFGNRGQANYAAAGTYQDAVARHRRARGLRAVTVDVGLMRDVGVLAETGMREGLKDWEVPYGIRERELLGIVKLAIAGSGAQQGDGAGEGLVVGPQMITGLATGGSAVAAGIETPWYLEADAKFRILAHIGLRDAGTGAGAGGTSSDVNGASSLPARLGAAASMEEAAAIITEALVARVAKTLQTTVGEIDTERFLHSYGIDSLAAIELVNWALKECQSHINVFDIMAAVPIWATAKKIAANSKFQQLKIAAVS